MSSKVCCNCYHFVKKQNNSDYICKIKNVIRDFDDRACRSFLDENTPSCYECRYYKIGTYIWNKDKCEIKNVNVDKYNPACSYFIED